MIPNKFFDTSNNIQFLKDDIIKYNVNNRNENYHRFHFYQIGDRVGTYLPNILTKFLNVSHVEYTYTWIKYSTDKPDIPKNINLIDHEDTGIENYVYSLPMEVMNGTWVIYWCDYIDKLTDFYTLFKKVYRQDLKYQNMLENKVYILIPSLSKDGASVSIHKNEKIISKSLINNIYKRDEYYYEYDMMSTLFMYNITLETIFKQYTVDAHKKYFYSNIGGNGVSVFKIDRDLCDLIAYDMI